ncbi:hypothetical protein M0638_19695 [Roseomonas sp. NAR14]|uniref:Uncharacterized protein n=1 Tax=Roseomonas acroporae TaxID=2937791 RepID=A0A9X1YAM4_9PROT|nr:hypothetical protein [Roseomonas acroporae]MCK8786603.1 hypothetical protein [Roseomonas acroporae]
MTAVTHTMGAAPGALPAPPVSAEPPEGDDSSADRALALAVLRQALVDAFELKRRDARKGETTPAAAEAKAEAMRFLTDADGEWAASRHAWCAAAGVEPEWLETRVREMRRGQ